jgi:hypothetical protein
MYFVIDLTFPGPEGGGVGLEGDGTGPLGPW